MVSIGGAHGVLLSSSKLREVEQGFPLHHPPLKLGDPTKSHGFVPGWEDRRWFAEGNALEGRQREVEHGSVDVTRLVGVCTVEGWDFVLGMCKVLPTLPGVVLVTVAVPVDLILDTSHRICELRIFSTLYSSSLSTISGSGWVRCSQPLIRSGGMRVSLMTGKTGVEASHGPWKLELVGGRSYLC
jgi:hypothetical protein